MTEIEMIYEWLENAPAAVYSYVEDGKMMIEIDLDEEVNDDDEVYEYGANV